MSISAEVLRQLHRIHRQRTDLRDRLERGPKQIRAAEGSVARLENDLEDARGTAKRARVSVDERQLQLREREARIGDLQKKLNSAASNREYQALKEQIAADQQANSVLEDEILEGLERIDQLTGVATTAEERLQRAKSEAEKVRQRVDGERPSLESELARVESELGQAERQLPADFRVEYQRIAQARGEEALAQVDGDVCGSCYQRLTTQMMSELYMSRPLFCKNCGALMYLAEGRSLSADS